MKTKLEKLLNEYKAWKTDVELLKQVPRDADEYLFHTASDGIIHTLKMVTEDLEKMLKEEVMLTLEDVAEFTWDFYKEFFLETAKGNYIWSDPEYGGDNTICKTNKSYNEWIDPFNNGNYGRSKGKHTVGGYCGPNVSIIEDMKE